MKKTIYLLSILSIASLLQSCSKTSGCTDPEATNYNDLADEDCKCCSYTGEVVFWYNKTTAENLVKFGSTNLYLYIDTELKGSKAANVYNPSQPNCGGNGTLTSTKILGNVKTNAASYKISDQDGDVIWQGVINYNANTCLKLELLF